MTREQARTTMIFLLPVLITLVLYIVDTTGTVALPWFIIYGPLLLCVALPIAMLMIFFLAVTLIAIIER